MNRALLAIAALWVLPAATGFTQPSTNNAISALMLSNGVAIPPVVSFGSVTNGTNVFQRAFGGEMEADRVVDRSATNWWAVFTIDDPASMGMGGFPRWTDVTLKGWTNGPTHMDGSTPVFRYTTTDAALNGTPSWETFTTNWYPRAFYCQVHESHDLTWLAEWKSIMPTYGGSIREATGAWDGDSAASNPFRWVIMVRDTRSWFHPTNNIGWAYTMHNDTTAPSVLARDGSTPLSNEVWNKVVPMWVSFDPRPKRFRAFSNTSGDLWVITNQHQQP